MEHYRLIEVWGKPDRQRTLLYKGTSKGDMQEVVHRLLRSERRPFSELRYYIGSKRVGAHQL